jgi:perosamine synthetase
MIPLFMPYIPPMDELLPALRRTFESGYIAQGDRVAEFEQRFGKFLYHPDVVAVSSCTAALHLALEMIGVRGGEVVSTPMTAEPTNLAILHAGADIVWADVDPHSGNICPASVEENITERTRAIMVVHYGGVPVDLDAIHQIAMRHNVPVVEDAAHALGAKYNGVMIGNHSHYVCFSFQSIKHLTTGDGGALTCPDAKQARRLRWFGIDRQAPRTEMDISELGYKYNMNDITATIGLVQLEHIDEVIQLHVDNGRYYDRALVDVPGLELCTWSDGAEPSYWLYTVLAQDRDGLSRKLAERSIASSLVHRRNDYHSIFARSKKELPGLDEFWSRMLHIPCGWWVTAEDREYIAGVIRSGW